MDKKGGLWYSILEHMVKKVSLEYEGCPRVWGISPLPWIEHQHVITKREEVLYTLVITIYQIYFKAFGIWGLEIMICDSLGF